MSGNQKQASAVVPQNQPRYPQGSYMPTRSITPHNRPDGYHVSNPPQAYVQQQPPNQANPGPGIRAMASSGPPPTQASTPPNAEALKVQQLPSNLTLNFRGAPPQQNFFRQQTPPNQSNRMASRPIYPQQLPFIQASGQPSFYMHNAPPQMVMFSSTQRPATNYVTPNYSMMPQFYIGPQTQGHQYLPYTPHQSFQIPRQLNPGQVQMTQPNQSTLTMPIVPSMPQQHETTPLPKTKVRRPNAVAIIDPVSGKDRLNEYFENGGSIDSGESSARQTPQPAPYTKDMPEMFVKPVQICDDASLVEDVAMNSHDLRETQVYHHQQLPPHTVLNSGHEPAQSKLKPLTKEFIPNVTNVQTIPSKETPVVSAITDAVEVTVKPNCESPNKGGRKRHREHKDSAKDNQPKEVVVQQQEKLKEEKQHVKEVPVQSNVAPVKETREEKREDKRNSKKDKGEKPIVNPPTAAISNNDNPTECVHQTLPPPVPENGGKSKGSQKKDPPKSQQQPQHAGNNAPAPKAGSLPVPQSQPAKANNKSNRVREINNKGATKEGTDMDAFNDKAPQQTAVSVPTADIINANVNINNNNTETIQSEPLKNEPLRTEPQTEPKVENATSNAEVKSDANANTNSTAAGDQQQTVPEKRPAPKSEFIRKGNCVTDIVKEVPRPIKITAPTATETSDETDCSPLSNERVIQVKNDANTKVAVDGEGNPDKVQLQYKEGQWSPANQAGKKVYDRDFLLALKNDPKSKKKPNCQIFDCIAADDKRGDSKYPMGGGRADFTPSFGGGKSASLSRGNVGGKSRSTRNSSGVNNNKNSIKKIVSISLKEDVKLRETEHAWKPARFIPSENMTEDDIKTASLYKKMRGILNKLTPQKFDILVNQVRELNIDSTERLQGIIDLVFDKAVDEPNFSEAYAKLCRELRRISVTSNGKDEKENAPTFIKLMVTRCQMEFEKNNDEDEEKQRCRQELESMTDLEKKKEMLDNLEEEERLIRVKYVGTARFIGELFKLNLLTVRIMERCLHRLIKKKDEENLECLCKLLTTVGSELEYTHKTDLSSYFEVIADLVHDPKRHKISSRVRFMLQDTIDLRANKWVPRRAKMAPKTMDQIQKEAENEALNVQVMNSMPVSHSRKDDRGMGSNSDRKGGRRNANVTNDDGWTTPAPRNNRNVPLNVQSGKLQNKTPQMDEPLGSKMQYSNWAHGSNIKPPSNSPSTNIYSCLDNNLDSDKRGMGQRPSSSRDFGGYMSKGSSMERHGKYDGRGSRSGSQHRSNDSRNTELRPQSQMQMSSMSSSKMPPPAPRPAAAPSPPPAQDLAPVELSDPQITWLQNTLDEYMTDSLTMDDTITEIKNYFPRNTRASFVDNAILHVLEKLRMHRIRTSKLLAILINSKEITAEDFCNASVFTMLDDLMIDMPKLFDYVAELLFHLVDDEAVPLSSIAKILGPVKPKGFGRRCLEPLFNMFMEEKGPVRLVQIWQSSGCALTDFVVQGEIEEFIAKNKLDCLTGSTVQPVEQGKATPEQLHTKLMQFFKAKENFDTVVGWVHANVGQRMKEAKYIQALATAIFEDSIRDKKFLVDVLKGHYNLLLKFVDNNQDLELQCLLAIQRLLHKLEHPKGVLVEIFSLLYEDTILSRETFLKYRDNNDPSVTEIEGRGVVVSQLTNFFFSLSEEISSDEQSDEN